MIYYSTRRSFLAAFFLLALIAGTVPASADKGDTEGISTPASTLYGVTAANALIRFRSSSPGTVTTIGTITGLQGGENVLGIDFRPATGQLYALGSTSRLYTINKTTAAATAVGVLSISLSGTEFGFDFNPTVDRIRIVSNTGQNLRANPNDASVTMDGALNPGTPMVTAAAYTNSFSGATTTTLLDIDTGNDTLFTQNPPNAGTLVSVGPLNVNATDISGFDIAAESNTAYAALTVSGVTNLYTINTGNGGATPVGAIGTGATGLRGLAAETGNPLPNVTVFGLTTTNQLVVFNSARPNTILRTVAITGLGGGENVLGIDFRPATGQLYALSSASRIYTINTVTGAATAIGSAGAFTLNGTDFGVDFNPTVDRIRVVSDADQNLRLNPNDGTLTMADTPALAYAAADPNTGQNPNITGAAYTNNFAVPTSTTLYDIDSTLNVLAIQNPPNNGVLNTVGPLGVDTTSNVGFDIAGTSGAALASFQLNGDTVSKLYRVDLTTGTALFIGPIGNASLLRDIAIAQGTAASETVDFDGDRKTDYSVFRLNQNTWYTNPSSGGPFTATQFGLAQSDFLTPGDFDGDGKTDVAVWRSTNGDFYVLRSSDGAFQAFHWGQAGDEPLARDYDGDGKTDFAVVRRGGGLLSWFVNNSSNGTFRAEPFGLDTDFTAPGDYDGDGRFDLGVRRGTGSQQATFFVQRSTLGFAAVPWGLGGDIVVPGDYDGDGKSDLAVVRQGSPYNWYVLRSSDNSLFAVQFGDKPNTTAQGDYDGDGKTDVGVFTDSGDFFVFRSSTNAPVGFHFGQPGDIPVAGFDAH